MVAFSSNAEWWISQRRCRQHCLQCSLLLAGGLPLVDTLELKRQARFSWLRVSSRFLVIPVSVQSFAALSGLAALGIFVGGRLMFGPRRDGSQHFCTFLAPITDSIDINYGAWMITPFIWANVLCLADAEPSPTLFGLDRRLGYVYRF